MSAQDASQAGPRMSSATGRESLFSTKNIVAVTVGSALYAALAVPFNVIYLPGASLITARPSIAIPVVFGIVFGPFAGFFSGFLGGVVSDQVSFGTLLWS